MTLTLTIVRHGDTFAAGEAPRRIGARTDLPLVASGETQARALGIAFAGEGVVFDRVLVSPLRRARATASLVLASLPAPPLPEPCEFLAEIDHGPDENQPEAAVLARVGEQALARWNDTLVSPPGWTVDAPARLDAWRALMAEGSGHMLLVTSAGAARFAFCVDASLAGQARALASTRLRTGAWGRIMIQGGRATIAAWDRRPEGAIAATPR